MGGNAAKYGKIRRVSRSANMVNLTDESHESCKNFAERRTYTCICPSLPSKKITCSCVEDYMSPCTTISTKRRFPELLPGFPELFQDFRRFPEPSGTSRNGFSRSGQAGREDKGGEWGDWKGSGYQNNNNNNNNNNNTNNNNDKYRSLDRLFERPWRPLDRLLERWRPRECDPKNVKIKIMIIAIIFWPVKCENQNMIIAIIFWRER